jgi:hypothetical protein
MAQLESLERLVHIWSTHSFDTRGPHDEVLSLLVSSVKLVLQATASQERRLKNVETMTAELSTVGATVARCNEAVQTLTEAKSRVDFLWASQGLSSLQIHPAAEKSSKRFHVADALPNRDVVPHSSQWRPAVEQALAPSAHPPADSRLDAASEALRRSIENQHMLTRTGVESGTDPNWHAVLNERLTAIEDVVDGVFGVARQLGTQVTKMTAELDSVQRYLATVDSRISINSDTVSKATQRCDEQCKKVLDTMEKMKPKLDDAMNATVKNSESVRAASSDLQRLAVDVAGVKGALPSAQSLSAMLEKAKGAQDAAKEHGAALAELKTQLCVATDEISALFTVLDVSRADAVALAKRGNGGTTREQGLQLIHRALPFKTIITGLQRLQRAPEAVEAAAGKGSGPRLGFRLRDEAAPRRCIVDDVEPDSLAAAAGVRAGDVVVAAGDSAVRSRDEFRIALSLIAQHGGPVVLRVRSAAADGKERTVTLL